MSSEFVIGYASDEHKTPEECQRERFEALEEAVRRLERLLEDACIPQHTGPDWGRCERCGKIVEENGRQ